MRRSFKKRMKDTIEAITGLHQNNVINTGFKSSFVLVETCTHAVALKKLVNFFFLYLRKVGLCHLFFFLNPEFI